MKILQIINSLGTGGAEKLLLDTIPLYRKAGIEMDILLLWDNDLPFTKALKELNCCKVHILKKSSNYKDIYSFFHMLKLRKIIKEYDILHVHLFPAQYFVPFANIGLNKKILFTEHNTSNNRIKNSIYKPVELYIYKKYSQLVCITEEIYQIYKNYLGTSTALKVIHNGVDIGKIQVQNAVLRSTIHKDIQEEDVLLIQVSAFRHQKDQETLIKAFILMPEKVKLILVGTGENLQYCQNITIDLGLENRVFFLGQRMDVPALLKTADIVILSSKYEGLSLSSIEGMASGKPFIASNAPGLREVVNGAGILFPIGNEVKLADEIMKLLHDKEYYNKIAHQCKQRAAEYDISKMVEKHIHLYKQVYEQD